MSSAVKQPVTPKKESYGLSAVWQQLETVNYIGRTGRIWQLLVETFKSITTSPVTALFSLVSISSALFVLGLFLLIFQNIESITQSSVQQLHVSVYLSDKLNLEDSAELKKLIENRSGVAKVATLSKEEALTLFSGALPEADRKFLADLEDNPLPASLEIELESGISRALLSQLVNELKDLPGILHVGYASEVFDRAKEFIAFFKLSGGAVVLVMLLVTAFVIASTIRMMLLQRQSELMIMRLVGATSFMVRVPCLLEGALFGLVGSFFALLSLKLFFKGLYASSTSVVEFVPMIAKLEFLYWPGMLIVVVVGTGIGLLASYVAARRI